MIQPGQGLHVRRPRPSASAVRSFNFGRRRRFSVAWPVPTEKPPALAPWILSLGLACPPSTSRQTTIRDPARHAELQPWPSFANLDTLASCFNLAILICNIIPHSLELPPYSNGRTYEG